MSNAKLRKRLKLSTVILAGAGLLLTLFSWAFASPVGSTPDEDFHLISIYCADGGVDGMCLQTDDPTSRRVSSSVVSTACFALQSDISADCQNTADVFHQTELLKTERGNFEAKYPQLFYSTMHLFASEDIQTSVISMRFFNAILFVAILTGLWLLMPRFMRPSLYFTVALSIVPLGLFLIPSVNPSSWAIIGVLTTFFGTAAALQAVGRERYALWALGLVGLLLAAGSRYDGLIYALVSLSIAFLLAKQFAIPRKLFWISCAGLSIVGAVALLGGGLSIIQNLIGLAGNAEAAGARSGLGVFAVNIATFIELWAGFSGAMGLGWLDTPVPSTAWMTAAALLWGVLFLRLARLQKRQIWATILIVFLLVAVPLATLQAGHSIVGENVQSRYLFPLFLVLVSTILLSQRDDAEFFSRVQIVVIMTGLFGSQALTIFMNMSRYISGVGGEGFTWNLNQAAASGWWWPTGPLPMTVLAVSIIGFGMFLSGALLFQREKSEPLGISKANSIAV